MNNISGRSVDTDTATGWGSGIYPQKNFSLIWCICDSHIGPDSKYN